MACQQREAMEMRTLLHRFFHVKDQFVVLQDNDRWSVALRYVCGLQDEVVVNRRIGTRRSSSVNLLHPPVGNCGCA